MSSVLMGPYATQLLGDMGADVIKVEPPDGDIVRQIGEARHPGMGGLYLNVNRSKRSIVLDLKDPGQRADLLRIARTCDVLFYNVRPKSMARLGLAYETLAEVNPKIIYVGVYGYGEDGPYAGQPAYDDMMQGASGLSSLMALGDDKQPRYIPIAIADRVVGLHAVNCVLAAIYHRDRSGFGQRIDVPMFETMVSMVMGDHMGGLTFDPPLDAGGYARLLAADRRPYPTKDGHICALIYNDKHWKSFFALIGRDDLAQDPRFKNHSTRTKHIENIYSEVLPIFKQKTSAAWAVLLKGADIPVMPLHTLESLFTDPHLQATNFFERTEHPSEGSIYSMKVPSTWSRTQPTPARHAPNLGEHAHEILAEAGFSEAEISERLGEHALQA